MLHASWLTLFRIGFYQDDKQTLELKHLFEDLKCRGKKIAEFVWIKLEFGFLGIGFWFGFFFLLMY